MDIPDQLRASHGRDACGRAWLDALPRLVDDMLDRWALRPDGEPGNGMGSLVVPVVDSGGRRALLKMQPRSRENAGTALGLRTWDGDGIVGLLDVDEPSGTQLLERLHGDRSLSSIPDDTTALTVLADLLARLVSVAAPPGMRRLADVAADMLAQVPVTLAGLADPDERDLVSTCGAAVADLLDDPGDRLLHWDLHYDNVLAADREPWLAIDPEPLAGDPGFDLLPALDNRWDDVVATGDVAGAVHRRFDLLTDRLGLDRRRASGWTLGRVLQNAIWDVEDGKHRLEPAQVAIAHTLLARHG